MNELNIQEPIGRMMGTISRQYLSLLHQQLSHLDIKRSFYPLLLIEAGKGSLTQNDLAKQLECDKVQVVRIVNYLSSKGYVKRVRNSQDKRKYGLEVTQKAEMHIPDIKEAIQLTTQTTLNILSSDQIHEFYHQLQLIEKNLTNHKNRSFK